MNAGALMGSTIYPFRYEIIDGIRGLAALAVVLHHLQVIGIGPYAVIVFFVISGYCIAASVDSTRRKGQGPLTFLARRLWRIYPTYWAALGALDRPG